MNIQTFDAKSEMGAAAAKIGAEAIRESIKQQGSSSIILATGASQFETMSQLVQAPDIDWSKVTCFHLDEYIGLPEDHPASFRRYLRERFLERLPTQPKAFHFVNGDTEPQAECQRLNQLIDNVGIDVAFIGIGENGHLAFNDPPADFQTRTPYLVVKLDDACRMQQFGEGWFEKLEDVPTLAITMSVQKIMETRLIVCTVPDERKAEAISRAANGPVTNELPASILQNHENCHVFLDRHSMSKLNNA